MFKKSTLIVCLSWSCLMVAAPAMAQDDADCMTTPDGNTVCDETTPTEPSDPSECEADADCSNGFTCEVVGGYSCAEPPPGSDGEPSPGEPCMSGEIKMCVPPPPAACDPAKASADCEGGLVCVTYTFEECSGGGRDGGAPTCSDDSDECVDEGQPEPPQCQSKAESVCVPKYLAPCQADADCGGGFKCVADEVCTADCAAPSPGDGDGGDREPEPSCQSTCAPSSQKYCELEQVTCSSDADCAQGLSCEEFSSPGVELCSVDDNGSEPVCSSEPATSESYCVPPDWQRWYGDSSSDADSPTSARDVLEKSTGNGWKIVDAENAGSGASAQNDAEADGGCQSTGAQSGSTAALSLLSLFGLIGWRRRKRA